MAAQAVEASLEVEAVRLDPAFVLPPEHRADSRDGIGVKSLGQDGDVPVIDMAHSEGLGFEELLSQVSRACEEWGFFQVINHGVPEELLAEMKREARAFFQQSKEEKQKVSRSFDNYLGYYDAERTKNVRDWKEVFDYAARGSLELPDLPLESQEEACGTTVLNNRWPDQPPGFRDACLKWAEAVEHLAWKLLSLISLSLGLPARRFHSFYQDHTAYVRINHYAACPAPDLALGVSRHKDSGALTVLCQDDAGGLQVKTKVGAWIDVKPRPDAFVINVGDSFQVWSNDRYKSVEHRAVVHDDKDRFSFPMFFNPNHRTDIEPIPELLDADHPPRYRKFNFGRYRKSRADSNFKVITDNNNDGSRIIHNIQISAFSITYPN